MKYARWIAFTLLVLFGLVAEPVSAAHLTAQQRMATSTNLRVNVYLSTAALKPIFQQQIDQQVATLSNNMISDLLGGSSGADQDWMKGLAISLIQPAATLSQLTPQKDGLAASVSLSFYPGDPQPIKAAMFVIFSVRDASTIQVSARPVAGSPQLADGPLTTFSLPIGQLQGISTTPNCGSAALNAAILMPVTFHTNQTSTPDQNKPNPSPQGPPPLPFTSQSHQQPLSVSTTSQQSATTLDADVEIPNSSLDVVGQGVGSLSIDNIWTAKNLHIKTQNNSIVITSDIALGETDIVLAKATTYVKPTAENGRLVMRVTNTTLSVFVFSFASDAYNKQIENMLNSNLGNALAGKFNVNSVGFGGGTAIPCASSDSLLLHGTTNVG
jgi:hypothetical protein